MISFVLPKARLEEAQRTAADLDAVLTIIKEEEYYSVPVYFVQVQANQPENLPVLLGYANIDGEVHSFSKEWTWTEESIAALDFNYCESCKTHHSRNKLFVVKVQDKIMKVGGHCAKELDCEQALSRLMKLRTKLGAMEEEFGCASKYYENMTDWMRAAAVYTKEFGYISKRVAEEKQIESTYDRITALIHPMTEEVKVAVRAEFAELSKKHLANEELEGSYWVKKSLEYLDGQEFSEYVNNCKVAINTGKPQLLGFAISVVGQLIKKEVEKRTKFVRTVTPNAGEKIEVKGKIARIVVDENQWGESLKITIDDEKYGKVWVRTTAKWAYDSKEGTAVECMINVKEVKDNIIFAARASKVCVNVG